MKRKKFLIPIVATFMLAAFTFGCKKDKYVKIDSKCPLVIATSPTDQEKGVALNKIITVTFNEKMDPATFSQASFSLFGSPATPGSLTYNEGDSSLHFVPTNPLQSDHTYTGIVTAGVKDFMGNALQADYTWSFSTGSVTVVDTLVPSVISTDPTNNATGVAINKIISATFSQPMDASTISDMSFLVSKGTTTVSGTVTYSGSTAFFTHPSDLDPGTLYTATITAAAKNLAGTPMNSDYIWNFTTGTTTVAPAPQVLSTSPVNNATGVALNKVVTATFNEPMDPATMIASSFLLKQGANNVAGTVSYASNTISFTPTSNLLPGVVYNATITTGSKNLAGISLANNYVWSFTTLTATVAVAPMVISTDPLNNATGVALNKVITATFDQQMDPLTITNLSFLLKEGTNNVTGNITYSGNTASFTPSANLMAGSLYSATITTAAENLAGTPITANYVWSFSTAATPTVPPFVDLKSAGRFGILAGVGISNNAGFSEIHDMDVGISPGVRSSVTGFPPAIVVNGAIYASDDIAPPGTAAMLIQAKQDLTDAYLFAEGASSPAPATVSGDLGGQTLASGIYKSNSTLGVVNGNLTLDGGGNPNAFWVFQIASAFTTVGGAGGSIILIGGAQAKNIFWQVGSSATIGDNTAFHGNILALTSITMNSNATATGRMLARNGSVVMTSTNIINKP